MRSHCILESAVIEGISRHWPVCASKRQPWYVHSIVCPSHEPAERGNARCGQTSRSANDFPAASRPSTSGMSIRVEVTSARPRSSSLRSAGYQKPHSNSPSMLEAVAPEMERDWLIVMDQKFQLSNLRFQIESNYCVAPSLAPGATSRSHTAMIYRLRTLATRVG